MDKRELVRLYSLEKKSVAQISKLFGRSQGKINYWLAKYGVPKRSISDAVYAKHNPNGDPFLFQAPRTKNDYFLFGLGLGLFWGEGNKKNTESIRLGNTDPDLVKVFIRFLSDMYGVPKERMRFGLQIFSDMDSEQALQFWMQKLKIPKEQFWKPIVTPARSLGTYRQKSKYGVMTVYVSNTHLREIVMQEIEALREV